jgi:hypothetical protein
MTILLSTSLQFPLNWPLDWERTPAHKRTDSIFRVTPEKAKTHLLEQLRLLKATQFILSTNIPVRKDGLPYANAGTPEDPGAALYYLRKDTQNVIPCDRYKRLHENIRAIGLALEALRTLDRHGITGMMDRAMIGLALPAPQEPVQKPWFEVFGVSPHAPKNVVLAVYKALAEEHHPDKGGDHHSMTILNIALQQAKAYWESL